MLRTGVQVGRVSAVNHDNSMAVSWAAERQKTVPFNGATYEDMPDGSFCRHVSSESKRTPVMTPGAYMRLCDGTTLVRGRQVSKGGKEERRVVVVVGGLHGAVKGVPWWHGVWGRVACVVGCQGCQGCQGWKVRVRYANFPWCLPRCVRRTCIRHSGRQILGALLYDLVWHGGVCALGLRGLLISPLQVICSWYPLILIFN